MANNDLNQIRIFSKVAQLCSFTKAANALGLEKSTVSAKISQLELRLGIRLLQRTTRSVSLTEAGSQYLSYCEQALNALQLGDEFIAELSHVPTGQLRVSAPQNLVEFWMPSVIMPFLKRYPKVSLDIIQTNEQLDLVKDGLDIAIRFSAEEIEDSSLIYRKIHHSEWVLVASQQHIDQFGLAQNPQQLLEQPSVGTTQENSAHQSHDYFHWQSQKVVLKHRFAVNNMNAIITAVKAGLGFAMIPAGMISKALSERQLIEINPDIKIKPTSLYVVYPSRSGQPAKLKAFVDVLIKWGIGDSNN